MRRRDSAAFEPRLQFVIADANRPANARDRKTSTGFDPIIKLTPRDARPLGSFVFRQDLKRHGILMAGYITSGTWSRLV